MPLSTGNSTAVRANKYLTNSSMPETMKHDSLSLVTPLNKMPSYFILTEADKIEPISRTMLLKEPHNKFLRHATGFEIFKFLSM